jgi:hypothetical protein
MNDNHFKNPRFVNFREYVGYLGSNWNVPYRFTKADIQPMTPPSGEIFSLISNFKERDKHE